MTMKNPPHPGLTVKHDCLEELGLSVTAGAEALGVTRVTLSKLINGAPASFGPGRARNMSKSPITTNSAATPNRVTTHPGVVLAEEFLKPLGMSVNAPAMALRAPATRIGAIVKGERSVTADTALRLARFFGTSPEFRVNLQPMHGLTKARQASGATIERDVHPRAAWRGRSEVWGIRKSL